MIFLHACGGGQAAALGRGKTHTHNWGRLASLWRGSVQSANASLPIQLYYDIINHMGHNRAHAPLFVWGHAHGAWGHCDMAWALGGIPIRICGNTWLMWAMGMARRISSKTVLPSASCAVLTSPGIAHSTPRQSCRYHVASERVCAPEVLARSQVALH